MCEAKPELSSRFLLSLVHKRTTHTLSQMPLSTICVRSKTRVIISVSPFPCP
uniref:Uncharacterized protein n=1 Tax=Microviridae sp. ctJby12 TaxID=2827622 RepID=A0A8S5LMS9_9VIRU|nr:MAG TPA: hypothetical protein [Microviridae sp. ctJby12]